MNEQQNPDGSWSKAEPEKASWEKRRHKKQKTGFYLQLRQLSAALVFIVVNSLYKHNHDDRMLTIFFVLSYTVFLLATVDNIKILKKLYDEVMKDDEGR